MSDAGPGEAGLEALRLLLVDDDAEQRSLVRRLFEAEGVSLIEEAADGDGAIEVAARTAPDLVVLDLVMPVRSGYEVLPELQARAPGARIVVLSNLPRRPLEELVRQRGAVGYVEKRVAPADLVGAILLTAALTDAATVPFAVELGASPMAARDARRVVREAIARGPGVDPTQLDAVELLVSELVTNAVIHASTAPRLAVRLSPATIRIEVHDDDPSIPAPLPPDAQRPGGRGLYLVEQLATRWGAEPDPDGQGKVVWFELGRAAG